MQTVTFIDEHTHFARIIFFSNHTRSHEILSIMSLQVCCQVRKKSISNCVAPVEGIRSLFQDQCPHLRDLIIVPSFFVKTISKLDLQGCHNIFLFLTNCTTSIVNLSFRESCITKYCQSLFLIKKNVLSLGKKLFDIRMKQFDSFWVKLIGTIRREAVLSTRAVCCIHNNDILGVVTFCFNTHLSSFSRLHLKNTNCVSRLINCVVDCLIVQVEMVDVNILPSQTGHL